MKKLMTMLALAASVITGANAWEIALLTGETNKVIAPPAVNYTSNRQIPARTATNVVAVGDLRRSGADVIICAVAGTTSTNVTITTYMTGGVYVALAAAQYAATNSIAVTTNSYITVAPLTVPETGLTAVDGSAYWFKVPQSRTALLLQPSTLASGAIVYYEDANGNQILEDAIRDMVKLEGFNGALYAHASDTGCTANVFCIP